MKTTGMTGGEKAKVGVLFVFVDRTVKLDTYQVDSLSNPRFGVVLCPFQASFQDHGRMRFSMHI